MTPRIAAVILTATSCAWAMAWGAHGHRTITYLALDTLPTDAPAWLRDATVRHRIAYQSSEADRWRGWRATALTHENDPDHYLDIDLLDQFGLTLQTLPPWRGEYLRTLAVSKHVHPETVSAYDASEDPDRTKEWPGFLPYAIAEHYAKLQSAFNQVRVLEQIGEPSRAYQLQNSRENALYHMGMLSHFVGDAAQPLHTTRHFNGWVGENPGGYTTARTFHAYIDTGVVLEHGIDYAMLRPMMTRTIEINRRDPWNDTLAHIQRSADQMERLYQLEKSGALRAAAGRELICARVVDAATMLRELYWSAWVSAVPTPEQLAAFVRYEERQTQALPEPVLTTQPASQPATSAPASQPATQPVLESTPT